MQELDSTDTLVTSVLTSVFFPVLQGTLAIDKHKSTSLIFHKMNFKCMYMVFYAIYCALYFYDGTHREPACREDGIPMQLIIIIINDDNDDDVQNKWNRQSRNPALTS